MKRTVFYIIMLFYVFSSLKSHAEESDYPQVRASVNPLETTIGVPVEYRVTISGKSLKGIEIRLPQKKIFYPEPEDIENESTEDTKETTKTTKKK